MAGPKVISSEERALSALWEFIACVQWGHRMGPELVRSGCFLNGILQLALAGGIGAERIAELIGQPERKVRKWIACSSATPRNPETAKLVVSKLGSEVIDRWKLIRTSRRATS